MATVIPGVYPKPTVTGPNGQAVIGPRPSRLHSVARWLDASGKLLGDSGVVIDGGDNLSVPGRVNGRVVQDDGANLDQLMALVSRIPSQGQKDALQGTVGTPGSANRFVTDSDPRLTGGGGGGGINPPAGQIGGSTSHPTVLGIRETGGPTELAFSSIADGELFRRSGSTIVGQGLPFANVGTVNVTATASIAANKNRVFVTALSANMTLTLPAASAVADGWEVHVFDRTNSAGNPYTIAVQPAGADTINGSTAARYITCPGDHLAIMQIGGAWYFTQRPANVLDVEVFGKLWGDGTHDDYAVIQAALDSGPNPSGGDSSGFRIFLRRGRYRISQPLKLRRRTIFEGEGSGGYDGWGTVIQPDKGVSGLIVSGVFDSGVTGLRADFSIVRNMGFEFLGGTQPAIWAATHSYSLSEIIVPTTSQAVSSGVVHHYVWEAAAAGVTGGSEPTWSDAAIDFLVSPGALVRSGSTVTVTTPASHGYSSSQKIYIQSSDSAFASGIKVVSVTGASTFTYSEAGTATSSSSDIEVARTITDGTVVWAPRSIQGIDIKVKTTIENVAIVNAPGNGIRVFGSTGSSPNTNCNEFVLRHVTVLGGGLNGIFIEGPDANAGIAEKCLASGARFWGIYDSSFLGNTHIAHDSDSNGLGAYHDDDLNAFNQWIGCYSEGGQPQAAFDAQRSIVSGGLHGAGITTTSVAMLIGVRQSTIEAGQAVTHKRINGSAFFSTGWGDAYPFAFGDSTINYSMGFGSSSFGGTHDALFQAESTDIYTAFLLSSHDSSLTSNTPGHIMFPNGIWLQGTGPTRPHISSKDTRPTTEDIALTSGSFFFNGAATEQLGFNGGVLGWQRVHHDVYNVGPTYATIRTPHFGTNNTQAKTNSVGSPYVIDAFDDAGITFVNDGAAAMVGFQLPPIENSVYSLRSTEVSFHVTYPDGIRIVRYPGGNRKIQWGTGYQSDYLESTTVGSWIKLKASFQQAVNGTATFIMTEASGIWSDGTRLFHGTGTDVDVIVTVDQALTVDDSGKEFLNSSADVVLTLPTSPPIGARYKAQVVGAHHIKFQAGGSNLIYNGVSASTAGGYIDSDAVGSTIELRWNGTHWFTKAVNGNWSLA